MNAGLLVAMGLGVVPFDPFPFGFLTLVVSLEAIFLSTFVCRAEPPERCADARAAADYEVNVRAEAEVVSPTHGRPVADGPSGRKVPTWSCPGRADRP